MPSGKHKSGRYRKLKKVMPGGTTRIVYEERKLSSAKCAGCGVQLQGIPRMSAGQARNTCKSKKRVARPYGGHYCSKCGRHAIKERLR